jgi:uncharacterized protein YchJ
MKKNYWLWFTCFICSLLLIVGGCLPKENTGTANPSAEQVVRDYFTYWNAKDLPRLEKTLAPARQGISWELDKLEYVKLISIKEINSSDNQSSDVNNKKFNVEFDIKFKDGYGSGLTDGIWKWNYLLQRADPSSPWLIYDWGV